MRHKRRYAVQVSWREPSPFNDRKGERPEMIYIEVDSPLDQQRPGGDPPRPYADSPRYAYLITPTNVLHVAGWIHGDKVSWLLVDLRIPWSNVITLQTFQHDDWEDKPIPEETE